MLTLRDALSKARTQNWSFINTFKVEFNFNPKITSELKSLCGFNTTNASFMGDTLELCTKSCPMPSFSQSGSEVWQNYEYRQNSGNLELYTFEVTFRDFDMLKLYRFFVTHLMKQRNMYFDDFKFDVTFWKYPDNLDENIIQVVQYENCMINGVSGLQFDNETENQIAEFSVTIKSTKATIFSDSKVNSKTYNDKVHFKY